MEINESEQVINFKTNTKRRASASWEKTCSTTTTVAHKSGEFAKKTKEDILAPTWEKTCIATSAAAKKSSDTAKPIVAKTVQATKTTAIKASQAGTKLYKEDIKPAGKAGKAISTSARRASLTAQTIFKTPT